MGDSRGPTSRDDRHTSRVDRAAGLAWDKVSLPQLPLSTYYADLKARRYIRAFVRGGGSEAERSRRGEVIDHWLLEKRVSSVAIVHAIKRAKDDG